MNWPQPKAFHCTCSGFTVLYFCTHFLVLAGSFPRGKLGSLSFLGERRPQPESRALPSRANCKRWVLRRAQQAPPHTSYGPTNFPSDRNLDLCTLRAALFGTFLQTLLELVTPLKGHSLSHRSCPPMPSAPS